MDRAARKIIESMTPEEQIELFQSFDIGVRLLALRCFPILALLYELRLRLGERHFKEGRFRVDRRGTASINYNLEVEERYDYPSKSLSRFLRAGREARDRRLAAEWRPIDKVLAELRRPRLSPKIVF